MPRSDVRGLPRLARIMREVFCAGAGLARTGNAGRIAERLRICFPQGTQSRRHSGRNRNQQGL